MRDPPESLPEMSKSFLRDALYGLSEHTRVFNQSTLKLLDEILTYNRYEIVHIKDVLAQSCKDMLVRCRLEGIEQDCSSMFDRSLSVFGYCCSFNIKANRAKPNFFGQQNGISVALNPEQQNTSIGTFFSEGMTVFVHHGTIYPNAVMQVILPVGRETLLAILPAYITSGEDMSMLSFEDRQCLYDYEGSLEYFPKYHTLNCIEECKAKWYQELCECVPFFYGNFPGVTVCNVSQIPCLQKNLEKVVTAIRERHNLRYECVCPPQCDELNYDVRSTFGNLDAKDFTIDKFYRDLNHSHVVLHAYFSKQVATVYERDLYFSWIDLIASIGGIFGLCVGGTCLSIIEVLYYGIGNFICNYCRKKQEKSTIDKADLNFEIKNRILTPS